MSIFHLTGPWSWLQISWRSKTGWDFMCFQHFRGIVNEIVKKSNNIFFRFPTLQNCPSNIFWLRRGTLQPLVPSCFHNHFSSRSVPCHPIGSYKKFLILMPYSLSSLPISFVMTFSWPSHFQKCWRQLADQILRNAICHSLSVVSLSLKVYTNSKRKFNVPNWY